METYKFKSIENIYATKGNDVDNESIQVYDQLQENDALLTIKEQRLKRAMIITLAVAIAFLASLELISDLIYR